MLKKLHETKKRSYLYTGRTEEFGSAIRTETILSRPRGSNCLLATWALKPKKNSFKDTGTVVDVKLMGAQAPLP